MTSGRRDPPAVAVVLAAATAGQSLVSAGSLQHRGTSVVMIQILPGAAEAEPLMDQLLCCSGEPAGDFQSFTPPGPTYSLVVCPY